MTDVRTGLEIVTLETPSLGDRSYLAIADGWAVAIDPQRDIDRVERVLADSGLRLGAVLETHLHNDYVTGGRALALRNRATYAVPAGPRLSYEARRVADGDELRVGPLTVRVLDAPGHTDAHTAYGITHRSATPPAPCSPAARCCSAAPAAPTSWDAIVPRRSPARSTARSVASAPACRPTPRCARRTGSGRTARPARPPAAGRRSATSDAPTRPSGWTRSAFVDRLLSGLRPLPPLLRGDGAAQCVVPHRGQPRSPARGAAGRRHRAGHDRRHPRRRRDRDPRRRGPARPTPPPMSPAASTSTAGAPSGRGSAGWSRSRAEVVLVASSPEEASSAQRELRRIGVDAIVGACIAPDLASEPAVARVPAITILRRSSFRDLATELGLGEDIVILDVREADERRALRIAGSVGVPLHELPHADLEPLRGRNVWVHCAAGFRATIAASILERAGIRSRHRGRPDRRRRRAGAGRGVRHCRGRGGRREASTRTQPARAAVAPLAA